MQAVSVDASPHLESDTASRNGDVPPERVFQRCRRYSRICGFIVAAIGAVVVLADVLEYLLGGTNLFLRFLSGGFWEGGTEMALTEGVAFLLCGGNLILHSSRNGGATRSRPLFLGFSACLVVLGSGYLLLAYFLSRMLPMGSGLYTDADLPIPFSVPPMSPLTAFFFLNAGLALLLVRQPSTRARACASLLTVLLAMLSAVILMCYGHGVELLKLTAGTHVALLTAIVFAVLSVGLICFLGPNQLPLRPFVGRNARALLLRAFLPVGVGLIVVNAIARSQIDSYLSRIHSQGWRRAFSEHLSRHEQAELVREMVEDDPRILPQVQLWSYQHARDRNEAVREVSDETIQDHWNQLDPARKWDQFSNYRRNMKQRRLSLFAALMGVLSTGAVILVIGYASRTIGKVLENANEKLRKANEVLSAARDAAEFANRTKNKFLANLHELRTPLTSIILYTETLMDEHQDEPAMLGDLQIIRDRGKYLVTLISDILTHVKLEANEVRLREPADVQLVALTEDVATTIEPLAKANGNAIRQECPDSLGTIYADVIHLKKCLINLLGNANKFTSNGTITLGVSRDAVEGHDWITFRVADTGIGMTPEQQARLFIPFFQGDSFHGGTGLGLAISRNLSQLMGGNLILETSQSNVGSTFMMRLPARPAAVDTMSAPAILVPTADDYNTDKRREESFHANNIR